MPPRKRKVSPPPRSCGKKKTDNRVKPMAITSHQPKESVSHKRAKGFALKSQNAILSGVSNLGIYLSPDGSRFGLSMERAPLNIPSHATNVSASLIKLSMSNDYQPKSDMPNPIFVETDFTYGGVNPQGNISQVIAMIPHEKKAGFINYETNTPLRVQCNRVLKGTNPQTVEIRLVDGEGRPIITTEPWSCQIIVEWEQEVELDYLKTSLDESQYY